MASHEEEQPQSTAPGTAVHSDALEKPQQGPGDSARPSEAQELRSGLERKSRSSSVAAEDLERAVMRVLRGLLPSLVVALPGTTAVLSRGAESGAASESLQQVVKLGVSTLGV